MRQSANLEFRQRIVACARAHLVSRGLRGVTMDDLCAELGISKKTLYGHFKSKAELLAAVVEDKISSVERDLAAIFAGRSDDFDKALAELLGCMQRHTDEVGPLFLRDVRRDAPMLFEEIQRRRSRMVQHSFGSLFEQGRRSGQVRKDIPVSVMIEILLGATQAVANPAKMSELGLSLGDCFNAVTSVLFHGIVTERKGKK